MYAIKVTKTGRYIKWSDDHWYETIPYGGFLFTYDEAQNIIEGLSSHYIYDIELINEDSKSSEHYNLITGKITKNTPEESKKPKIVTKLSSFRLTGI